MRSVDGFFLGDKIYICSTASKTEIFWKPDDFRKHLIYDVFISKKESSSIHSAATFFTCTAASFFHHTRVCYSSCTYMCTTLLVCDFFWPVDDLTSEEEQVYMSVACRKHLEQGTS